jgi:hypothetical protein
MNFQYSQPSQHHHRKAPNYSDLKEAVIRIWQLKMAYKIPLTLLTTSIVPNKLHDILKLLNHHPDLYILMQKAVIITYIPYN